MRDRKHHVVVQIDEGLQGLSPPGLEAKEHDAHYTTLLICNFR